ncbi:MAG: OB-fold protein [Thermoleophilia bacterium]
MKKLLVIPVLLLIALAMMGNDSGCSSSKTASAPESGPGSAAEPMKVDATAFVGEFDANKISAQDKYKDKYIQTTGFVKNISGGDVGGLYAVLDPSQGRVESGITVPYFGTNMQCYLEKADASGLTNGQQVTVKGQVEDMSIGSVQLKNCSVVK